MKEITELERKAIEAFINEYSSMFWLNIQDYEKSSILRSGINFALSELRKPSEGISNATTEDAAVFWAKYFNSTKEEALECHHMTIDCMVKFAELSKPSESASDVSTMLCDKYGITIDYAPILEEAYEIGRIANLAPFRVNAAIMLIADERDRQIEVEGWTAEHDDKHTMGELAQAASCYALPGELRLYIPDAPENWPWAAELWKPANCEFDTDENYIEERVKELKKAGSLIIAEIERLQRLQNAESKILANHSKTCKE